MFLSHGFDINRQNNNGGNRPNGRLGEADTDKPVTRNDKFRRGELNHQFRTGGDDGDKFLAKTLKHTAQTLQDHEHYEKQTVDSHILCAQTHNFAVGCACYQPYQFAVKNINHSDGE